MFLLASEDNDGYEAEVETNEEQMNFFYQELNFQD